MPTAALGAAGWATYKVAAVERSADDTPKDPIAEGRAEAGVGPRAVERDARGARTRLSITPLEAIADVTIIAEAHPRAPPADACITLCAGVAVIAGDPFVGDERDAASLVRITHPKGAGWVRELAAVYRDTRAACAGDAGVRCRADVSVVTALTLHVGVGQGCTVTRDTLRPLAGRDGHLPFTREIVRADKF